MLNNDVILTSMVTIQRHRDESATCSMIDRTFIVSNCWRRVGLVLVLGSFITVAIPGDITVHLLIVRLYNHEVVVCVYLCLWRASGWVLLLGSV